MNMMKIMIVAILGLPAVFSVLTLPATVMTISGVNATHFEAKLTLLLAVLVLLYPATYLAGTIFLFNSSKLQHLAIPAIHLALSLIVWGLLIFISNQNAAHKATFRTAIENSLHSSYVDAVQFKVDYSSPSLSHNYLCSLYDSKDGTYFLVEFDSLAPESIAAAIAQERARKNQYIAAHTSLVNAVSPHMDNFVVIASSEDAPALYAYATLDDLAGGHSAPIEHAINAKNSVIEDVSINIGNVPRYAKAGFIEYAPVNGTFSRDERTANIRGNASFKLMEAKDQHTENHFAQHYGVVPTMIMDTAQSSIYCRIEQYAQQRNVTITSGTLDLVDGRMVIRGEYTDDASGFTGHYTYQFMTIDILIDK